MNKSKHVTFRCTDEQYKELKWQAGFAETSLSAYIVNNLCPRYLTSTQDDMKAQEDLNRMRSKQLERLNKDKP